MTVYDMFHLIKSVHSGTGQFTQQSSKWKVSLADNHIVCSSCCLSPETQILNSATSANEWWINEWGIRHSNVDIEHMGKKWHP